MKKIFLLFLLLISVSYSQRKTGSLASPYSTSGWDTLAARTIYYQLPIYRLLSNPGGWININQRMIDSLFNALIVFVDTTQHQIINDTLLNSSYSSGIDSFVGTAQTDTVSIVGLDSLDVVVVSVRSVEATSKDILSVKLIPNKAVIMRQSGGTSGLPYNWIWRRRYQ